MILLKNKLAIKFEHQQFFLFFFIKLPNLVDKATKNICGRNVRGHNVVDESSWNQ